jgi:hypothetical protein
VSTVRRVADVITLPARAVGTRTADLTSGAVRVWAADEVDDWGRDHEFVDRVLAASRLRWDTTVGGTDHLPKRAGALIVVNARRFALAPVFAALAIGAEVGRPVRFVGRPDVAPIGPFLQRVGGLLPVEGEIEGALRAGELVLLGTDHHVDNRRCGRIDHCLVGAAITAGVRVLPAATVSVPIRRRARVEIGAPVRLARKRRGPLAELETADQLRVRIDALLDEFAGPDTGTPLDWLPTGRFR